MHHKGVSEIEREDMKFRAIMTQNQFSALATKLKFSVLFAQLKNLAYFSEFRPSPQASDLEIRKLLLNGWNTEYLLKINYDTLSEDSLRHSIQWAFPQAYYSAYTIAFAYFKLAGHPECSHTGVIKKIGSLMFNNNYPAALSFIAFDYKPVTFMNITETLQPYTLYYDGLEESVNNQICQFLRSTRKMELKEKRDSFKDIKTKRGGRKIRLISSEWKRVSESIGYTSIYNLLYRKRIKSNYRDIDTFLCEDLDPVRLFKDLIKVVKNLNAVHEAFLIRGFGYKKYLEIARGIMPQNSENILKRAETINDALVQL